jgi:hypothetical protein
LPYSFAALSRLLWESGGSMNPASILISSPRALTVTKASWMFRPGAFLSVAIVSERSSLNRFGKSTWKKYSKYL